MATDRGWSSTRPRPTDPRAALRGLAGRRPGLLTTAYLALKLYQPDFDAVVMPFDRIEDAVHRGEVDVGLLIHEGQLTYGDAGLHLWADLGAWWHGGDRAAPAARRERRAPGPGAGRHPADRPRPSREHRVRPRAPRPRAGPRQQYNRGIGDERTDTFVGMYVNQWTVDYGLRGRKAVQKLLDRGHEAGVIPERVQVDFVDSTGD